MEFSVGIFIGTAFQIGAREIVTCAHNLYQRSYCEQAINVCYIPAANGIVEFERMEGIDVK